MAERSYTIWTGWVEEKLRDLDIRDGFRAALPHVRPILAGETHRAHQRVQREKRIG